MQREQIQSLTKNALIAVSGVLLLFVLMFMGKLFENLSADKVMCVQNPLTGTLTWHISPGVKWQGFGHLTKLTKLECYSFNIPVRFNDGGHGTIIGSVNYEVPLDNDHLTSLLVKYGSQQSIQKDLIEVVTNKCIYMTGPLMSSKESYAEKRTSLIFYIEDQIKSGVYKTTQEEVKTKDPITGVDKTITVAKIVTDKDGNPMRQEEAVLAVYGIRTSNFAVTQLPYDEAVEGQIKQQQGITMAVQTAMAKAKEAEQNAITVGKEGEAAAMKSKWEQEVLKAKAVVQAEQQLEVSILERKAAEQKKQRDILEGEGESTKRRLIMGADGALQIKINAWVEAQKIWADAVSKQKWVPEIQMGTAGGTGSRASDMVDLLTVKTAKELGLEMHVPKGGNQ
jgi:hypothetical protein